MVWVGFMGRCSTAQIAIAQKNWSTQKRPLPRQAVNKKNDDCSNQVNPWINLFKKI